MEILEQIWQDSISIGSGASQIVGFIPKYFFFLNLSILSKESNSALISMGIQKNSTPLFMHAQMRE